MTGSCGARTEELDLYLLDDTRIHSLGYTAGVIGLLLWLLLTEKGKHLDTQLGLLGYCLGWIQRFDYTAAEDLSSK